MCLDNSEDKDMTPPPPTLMSNSLHVLKGLGTQALTIKSFLGSSRFFGFDWRVPHYVLFRAPKKVIRALKKINFERKTFPERQTKLNLFFCLAFCVFFAPPPRVPAPPEAGCTAVGK
jgi:hypothetical protein